jgi:hypothetical protein
MLGGLAYFPLGLGLAILVGRREVTLRGGKLRTTERVGFLARTKRWPLATLDSVQIVGFVPAPAEGHKEGTLLSRLDALSGVLTDGTRFMVVPAYPRRLLAPFAAELARRCDARFDTTEYRRPKVQVTTLVSGDAPAAEHDYNVDQPADSRVVLEEYPEGVTITVPPLGFGGASIALTLAGLAVMGVTGSVAASMEAPSAKAYGICAAIAFVGLMLALHGVRVARRRVVIAIVLPQLMILQTGLVRSLRRTWDVGELMTVRVGPSGIQVNEEDVLELQIVPLSGPKFGLLCGRDVPEIRWIAGVLRRCLNVPARLAAPSEK